MPEVKSEGMIEIVINLTHHENEELVEAIKRIKYFANGKNASGVATRLARSSFSEILKVAKAITALTKFAEDVLVEPEV